MGWVTTRIAIWNCADQQLPHAEHEIAGIEKLRSDDVDVVVAGRSVDWARLGRFLTAVQPTVFHFIGHGHQDGTLDVIDGRVTVARSIKSVLAVVRAASRALTGVYLSGCFTSTTGPEPLDALIPNEGWVVGTSSAVDDDVAAEFAVNFYGHLLDPGAHGDARWAFDLAKSYIRADLEDDPPHAIWMALSSMPPVDTMARTIHTALRGVFDRSAMQVPMARELSITELDDALLDITHALGTGQVRSRRTGEPIDSVSFPVEWLYEPRIAEFVRTARYGVAAIRRGLAELQAGAGGQNRVIGNVLNFDPPVSPQIWMKRVNSIDHQRNKIINAANELMAGTGVPRLPKIKLSFSPNDIRRAAP